MASATFFRPMTPSGGAFLICVGAGLIALALTPPPLTHHNQLFLAAGIGVGALVLTAIVAGRRLGAPSRAQRWLIWPPVILQVLLLWWLGSSGVSSHLEPRSLWVLVVAIVGAHFLPMYWSFGPIIVCLGCACLAWAATAWLAPSMPLNWVVAGDGALKFGFGLWMVSALLATPRRLE